MDYSTQLAGGPIYGYTYYFILVIFGSFCLLNLTVATVGQTYARVKKQAEVKRAAREKAQAEMDKIQAERDEMSEFFVCVCIYMCDVRVFECVHVSCVGVCECVYV
jgi:hypothetical protein